MQTFSAFMRDHHQRCDGLFVEAERLAMDKNTSGTRAAHDAFTAAMDRHFAMEEDLLFPAFEEARGGGSGPVAVMLHEHRQMRELFREMGATLERHDYHGFLAAAETLLILMQQHNAKEEQILYPMIDLAIPDRAALFMRLREIAVG